MTTTETRISKSSVRINTERFVWRNGHEPRGCALWWFEEERVQGGPSFRVPHPMLYAEAKKLAKAWAADQGIRVLVICP